jgi:hypothetical protein
MSTYTHAGVSRRNGTFKVRFSNRDSYVEALVKAGDTDIDLIPLREPMTKEEAIDYLIGIDFPDGNAEVMDALENARVRRQDRAATADKPRRPRKSRTVDPVGIRNQLAKLDPEVRGALLEDLLAQHLANAFGDAAAEDAEEADDTEDAAEIAAAELEDEEAPF